VGSAFEAAEIALVDRVGDYGSSLAKAERARRNRIREQINRDAERDMDRINRLITEAEAKSGDQPILRIRRAELEKIDARRRRLIEDMAQDREPSISGTTFAAGLVDVTATDTGETWQEQHS